VGEGSRRFRVEQPLQASCQPASASPSPDAVRVTLPAGLTAKISAIAGGGAGAAAVKTRLMAAKGNTINPAGSSSWMIRVSPRKT